MKDISAIRMRVVGSVAFALLIGLTQLGCGEDLGQSSGSKRDKTANDDHSSGQTTSEDKETFSIPDNPYRKNVRIYEHVKLVPKDIMKRGELGRKTIVLPNDNKIVDQLKKGSIVMSRYDGGIFQKVTSVERTSKKVILKVKQARLGEAVASGQFYFGPTEPVEFDDGSLYEPPEGFHHKTIKDRLQNQKQRLQTRRQQLWNYEFSVNKTENPLVKIGPESSIWDGQASGVLNRLLSQNGGLDEWIEFTEASVNATIGGAVKAHFCDDADCDDDTKKLIPSLNSLDVQVLGDLESTIKLRFHAPPIIIPDEDDNNVPDWEQDLMDDYKEFAFLSSDKKDDPLVKTPGFGFEADDISFSGDGELLPGVSLRFDYKIALQFRARSYYPLDVESGFKISYGGQGIEGKDHKVIASYKNSAESDGPSWQYPSINDIQAEWLGFNWISRPKVTSALGGSMYKMVVRLVPKMELEVTGGLKAKGEIEPMAAEVKVQQNINEPKEGQCPLNAHVRLWSQANAFIENISLTDGIRLPLLINIDKTFFNNRVANYKRQMDYPGICDSGFLPSFKTDTRIPGQKCQPKTPPETRDPEPRPPVCISNVKTIPEKPEVYILLDQSGSMGWDASTMTATGQPYRDDESGPRASEPYPEDTRWAQLRGYQGCTKDSHCDKGRVCQNNKCQCDESTQVDTCTKQKILNFCDVDRECSNGVCTEDGICSCMECPKDQLDCERDCELGSSSNTISCQTECRCMSQSCTPPESQFHQGALGELSQTLPNYADIVGVGRFPSVYGHKDVNPPCKNGNEQCDRHVPDLADAKICAFNSKPYNKQPANADFGVQRSGETHFPGGRFQSWVSNLPTNPPYVGETPMAESLAAVLKNDSKPAHWGDIHQQDNDNRHVILLTDGIPDPCNNANNAGPEHFMKDTCKKPCDYAGGNCDKCTPDTDPAGDNCTTEPNTLATDKSTCNVDYSNPGYQHKALEMVRKLKDAGVSVEVIGAYLTENEKDQASEETFEFDETGQDPPPSELYTVGEGKNMLTHLALAGTSRDLTSGGPPWYPAEDAEGVKDAFSDIVGKLSCTVKLDHKQKYWCEDSALVEIANNASVDKLTNQVGFSEETADEVISNRPYEQVSQLNAALSERVVNKLQVNSKCSVSPEFSEYSIDEVALVRGGKEIDVFKNESPGGFGGSSGPWEYDKGNSQLTLVGEACESYQEAISESVGKKQPVKIDVRANCGGDSLLSDTVEADQGTTNPNICNGAPIDDPGDQDEDGIPDRFDECPFVDNVVPGESPSNIDRLGLEEEQLSDEYEDIQNPSACAGDKDSDSVPDDLMSVSSGGGDCDQEQCIRDCERQCTDLVSGCIYSHCDCSGENCTGIADSSGDVSPTCQKCFQRLRDCRQVTCPASCGSCPSEDDGENPTEYCDGSDAPDCLTNPDLDCELPLEYGCLDNCPTVQNPNQTDSDGDGIGDACDHEDATHDGDGTYDSDQDGIIDSQDNCQYVKNPKQTDRDGDGVGDLCDIDIDENVDVDEGDDCNNNTTIEGVCQEGDRSGANACDTDMDGDGILNPNDPCPKIYNGSPNSPDPSKCDNVQTVNQRPEPVPGNRDKMCVGRESLDPEHAICYRQTCVTKGTETLRISASWFNETDLDLEVVAPLPTNSDAPDGDLPMSRNDEDGKATISWENWQTKACGVYDFQNCTGGCLAEPPYVESVHWLTKPGQIYRPQLGTYTVRLKRPDNGYNPDVSTPVEFEIENRDTTTQIVATEGSQQESTCLQGESQCSEWNDLLDDKYHFNGYDAEFEYNGTYCELKVPSIGGSGRHPQRLNDRLCYWTSTETPESRCKGEFEHVNHVWGRTNSKDVTSACCTEQEDWSAKIPKFGPGKWQVGPSCQGSRGGESSIDRSSDRIIFTDTLGGGEGQVVEKEFEICDAEDDTKCSPPHDEWAPRCGLPSGPRWIRIHVLEDDPDGNASGINDPKGFELDGVYAFNGPIYIDAEEAYVYEEKLLYEDNEMDSRKDIRNKITNDGNLEGCGGANEGTVPPSCRGMKLTNSVDQLNSEKTNYGDDQCTVECDSDVDGCDCSGETSDNQSKCLRWQNWNEHGVTVQLRDWENASSSESKEKSYWEKRGLRNKDGGPSFSVDSIVKTIEIKLERPIPGPDWDVRVEQPFGERVVDQDGGTVTHICEGSGTYTVSVGNPTASPKDNADHAVPEFPPDGLLEARPFSRLTGSCEPDLVKPGWHNVESGREVTVRDCSSLKAKWRQIEGEQNVGGSTLKCDDNRAQIRNRYEDIQRNTCWSFE